jgi:hypothetical protein
VEPTTEPPFGNPMNPFREREKEGVTYDAEREREKERKRERKKERPKERREKRERKENSCGITLLSQENKQRYWSDLFSTLLK